VNKISISFLFVISTLIWSGCLHDRGEINPDTGYPDQIEKLVVNKCASSGCHNEISREGAAGLALYTWDALFQGSRGGACVIPYRPDFSLLMYYTNTDTNKGLALLPTMPYLAPSLSSTEYELLKKWIENGAPNESGFVKFSDFEFKEKLYVCNRGCDVVTVVDPSSGLAMRYIDVGIKEAIESPAMVKVSNDKKHWYVLFNGSTVIQKFQTSDNLKVGELTIGSGIWSSITLTGDSKKAFITDADVNGSILVVDIENMHLITTYQSVLRYPYKACINTANDLLYVTSQEGNFIYKIDVSNPSTPVIAEISLETGLPASIAPSLNPNAVILSKDESVYFISCQKSSELRMMNSTNDSLIGVFSIGSNPGSMAISTSMPYLFVSCMGAPGTSKKAAVFIFNYENGTFISELYAGHDSNDVTVSESFKKVFVVNRNVNPGGPASHHASVCEGKNGYLTAIDLNTLQVIPDYRPELSVDSYAIAK